jgi:transposase
LNNITIKTLLNDVHPIKGFCYHLVHWSSPISGVLTAQILSRKGSRGICSGCERPGPTYDHLPKRQWRFVPLWALPVFLVYALRRIDCKGCGIKVEKVPWATGKIHLADAFRLFLAQWARKLSWSEVADSFLVSWADVYDSVKWVVDYGLKHRVLGGIGAIGVDEILVARGRKFWTLVYQIDEECRRLLWIGKDRTEKTFGKFFNEMGTEVCKGIGFVCSDMWKPYLAVVKERLKGALHILDRFHIRKNQNEAVDEVRREEASAMRAAGLSPLLKKMRWAFLKRRGNWTSKERRRMRELQGSNLRTLRAFMLVEAFQHFWTYRSPAWAGKFLNGWCMRPARDWNRSRKWPGAYRRIVSFSLTIFGLKRKYLEG